MNPILFHFQNVNSALRQSSICKKPLRRLALKFYVAMWTAGFCSSGAFANSLDLGFTTSVSDEAVDFLSMKLQKSSKGDRRLRSVRIAENGESGSSTKPAIADDSLSTEVIERPPQMSDRSVLLAQNDSLDIWQSELLSDFKNEVQEVDLSPAVTPNRGDSANSDRQSGGTSIVPTSQDSLFAPVTTNPVVSSSKRDLVEVDKTEMDTESLFRVQTQSLEYVSLEIELVDDRTQDLNLRKYPLRGMKVQLVGTSFMSISDENGIVRIDNLPSRSTFEFLAVDPFGRVERSHFSVFTSITADDKIVKKSIFLRRSDHIAQLAEIAGEVFDNQRASICGAVYDSSKIDRVRLKGVQAFIAEQQNAFALYDGQNSLPSPDAQATSESGRFCFFGIRESLSTINFFEGDRFIGTFVVATPAGTHKELVFALDERQPLEVVASVVGSAAEQLTRSERIRNRRDFVDFVEVFPFGATSPLAKGLSEGLLEDSQGVLTFEDKTFLAANSSLHERSIYVARTRRDETQGASNPTNFLTLYPQGFVEDMAHEANISYRSDLGALVVEHRKYDNEPFEGHLKTELYDENFNLVSAGSWTWDERPVQKSIFFNLNPGRYHVILKTSAGHWISAHSTLVYSEHLSVVESGADLLFTNP